MFDINTILTQALTAAVAEAMLPLQQEYANKMGEMATRIAALEAQLAAQATPAPQIDAAAAADALNSQEWFWEKVRRFADAAAEEHMEEHMEQASHFDDDDIDTKIDAAIEKHEEDKTHGDDDDIEAIVQRLLNSASISITV
jgi:hypothetical protein